SAAPSGSATFHRLLQCIRVVPPGRTEHTNPAPDLRSARPHFQPGRPLTPGGEFHHGTTEARRHGGTEARRHGGAEARRHGGTEGRLDRVIHRVAKPYLYLFLIASFNRSASRTNPHRRLRLRASVPPCLRGDQLPTSSPRSCHLA